MSSAGDECRVWQCGKLLFLPQHFLSPSDDHAIGLSDSAGEKPKRSDGELSKLFATVASAKLVADRVSDVWLVAYRTKKVYTSLLLVQRYAVKASPVRRWSVGILRKGSSLRHGHSQLACLYR